MKLLLSFAVALSLATPLVPLAVETAQAQSRGNFADNRELFRLQRAGSRRGRVCAFYSGRSNFEDSPFARKFSKRACFTSASACQAWFYKVQTAFPRRNLSKRCGRA